MAGGDRSGADGTLVAALAGGKTVQDAAASAGVAERTVYRRLDEPAFRTQVDKARRELIAQAVARLSASATDAADTLKALLGKDTPPAVRLGAARSILDVGLRLREHENLAERVAALEGQLGAEQGGTRRWGG